MTRLIFCLVVIFAQRAKAVHSRSLPNSSGRARFELVAAFGCVVVFLLVGSYMMPHESKCLQKLDGEMQKLRILPMIRDVLFVMGCAAGVLLAISQYISMFSE